jgi:predicted transcriptional regulator
MQLNSYRYFGSPPSPEALSDETLDAVFSALADSTRRKILARLAEGEASVAELAEPFQLSQPAVSKHLKVLENAGLVSHARDNAARASWRPRASKKPPTGSRTIAVSGRRAISASTPCSMKWSRAKSARAA